MNIYPIFILIAYARAAAITEECSGVHVKGQYYEKHVLKDNLDRPYLLTLDKFNQILYFSHSLDEKNDIFQTAYINLNNHEFTQIGIPNGFAQTVDEETHIVYIGGDDGIYKYNIKDKSTEYFAAKGENIWRLHFDDVLYYINFPSQFLYVIQNNETSRFIDLEDTKVDFFLIDKNNTIFFVNETGFYEQEKDTKDAKEYQEIKEIRALTLDSNGTPYVCTSDGIFEIDRQNRGFVKILTISDAFGLVFDDQNNIIYADAESIIKLVPSESECIETTTENANNENE